MQRAVLYLPIAVLCEKEAVLHMLKLRYLLLSQFN
jgi:hypothetical protein